MTRVWVTGEDAGFKDFLIGAVDGMMPRPVAISADSLCESPDLVRGSLVLADFEAIDQRARELVSVWERNLGGGQVVIFTSEMEDSSPRAFRKKSLDVRLLRYIVHNAIERIGIVENLRQAETEREAALWMSRELLSGMAHDLRSPVNSVIGFAELLGSAGSGFTVEKQSKYLNNIAKSGRALLQLIDDIVDLSRIDSGKLALDLEPVDVIALVNDAIRLLREKAQKRGVTIGWEAPSSPIGEVLVDRRRLKQTIYLVLSGQIDASAKGSKMTITIDRDATNVRLAANINAGSNLDLTTERELLANVIPLWQTQYVERVLEQHGAGLKRDGSNGKSCVELRLQSAFSPPAGGREEL